MHQTAKHMRGSGMKHARTIRNEARASAMKRKEEYLGARVPKELRDKVIAQADVLGIPVSILIRNILEEAFNPVNTAVSPDTGAQSGGTQRMNISGIRENDEYPTVIGWEVMTLNRVMICSGCGDELRPGTVITLGLAGPGDDHVILCGKCKKLA